MMYIQATDGLFYANPLISGDDWYLTVTDDGIKLIMLGESITSVKEKTLAQLEPLGIHIKFKGKTTKTKEMLPPDFNDWADCFVAEVEVIAPIPPPKVYGFKLREPMATEKVYGFQTDFTVRAVFTAVAGGEVETFFLKALLAQAHWTLEMRQIRTEMTTKIYKQHPWIRALDLHMGNLEHWIAKYGENTPVSIKWRRV